MTQLTTREIRDLSDLLGSFTQLGLASACEGRADPQDWVSGKSSPNAKEMRRLVVLKKAMDKIVGSRGRSGRVAAREWATTRTCRVNGTMVTPVTAVSTDHFKEVEDAVP